VHTTTRIKLTKAKSIHIIFRRDLRALKDYEFPRCFHKPTIVVGCCGNKSNVVETLSHQTRNLLYGDSNINANYFKIQDNIKYKLTIH